MEKLSGSDGDEALRQCYLNKVMTEFEMVKLSEQLIVQAKNLAPEPSRPLAQSYFTATNKRPCHES